MDHPFTTLYKASQYGGCADSVPVSRSAPGSGSFPQPTFNHIWHQHPVLAGICEGGRTTRLPASPIHGLIDIYYTTDLSFVKGLSTEGNNYVNQPAK